MNPLTAGQDTQRGLPGIIKDNLMEYLVEAILFIILLTTIYAVLEDNPLIKKGRLVFSVCVSLLCIIAMQQFFTPTRQAGT